MTVSPTTPSTHRADVAVSCADITTVSIIGAGVMGRAIAACSVASGYHVRIVDVNLELAANAVRAIQAGLSVGAKHGPHFLSGLSSSSVTMATIGEDLADSNLVIEAVPEKLATKLAVLSSIEPHLLRHAVIASNTSSIPIAEMAEALQFPERLCGLHFCHPVSERTLVEVISATSTSIETERQAFAYAASLGKSPVKVRDSPGFVLNRLLSLYLTEALELMLEGVDVELLDEVACEFGMPCGPLRHLDEFGIDVSLQVGSTLLRAYPERFVPSELLIAMYKAGRLGCKSGEGFYGDGGNRLAPAVREIISNRCRTSEPKNKAEVTQRLLMPMLLEATRILEEGGIETADAIDSILRDGLGTTSCYRGLFSWADACGAETFLNWLEHFQVLGKRFEPTSLLNRAVANGERFTCS